MSAVGANIRFFRLRNGWSLDDLGKKLRVSRSAVNQWEMGGGIRHHHLIELARLFGVSLTRMTQTEPGIEDALLEIPEPQRSMVRRKLQAAIQIEKDSLKEQS